MAKRVLLAEDDGEMCRLLADALRLEGYEVTETFDGLELLDLIDALRLEVLDDYLLPVDLIISDIRMPWVSGLEVLRELRQRDRATPVILITAFGDEQTHAEARRLGACAVLDKPFDLDQFRDLVRQHLPPPLSESRADPSLHPGCGSAGADSKVADRAPGVVDNLRHQGWPVARKGL